MKPSLLWLGMVFKLMHIFRRIEMRANGRKANNKPFYRNFDHHETLTALES